MSYIFHTAFGDNMKKNFLIIFLSSLFFFSCSLKGTSWENLKPCRINSLEIDFALDFPVAKNIPVVKLRMAGIDYFMVADTGCENSILFNINENNESSFLKIKTMNDFQYVEINENIDGKLFKSEFVNSSYGDILIDGNNDFSKLSGILGLSFFKLHENVVIDYKKQKILFDNQSNCFQKNEMDMYDSGNGLYVIDFLFNGCREKGLIDTGCDLFVTRVNFGNDVIDIEPNDFRSFYYKNLNVPVRALTKSKTIKRDNVLIGDIKYKRIRSVEGTDEERNATWRIINTTMYYNLLGSEIFKNHLIGIDFKRNKFCIN